MFPVCRQAGYVTFEIIKNIHMKNKIRVIFEGGFKSCCNVFSADQLKVFTNSWFDKYPDIDFDIIDIEYTPWKSEPMAEFAYKHLKKEAFPLTYCNDILVSLAHFPERDFEHIKNTVPLTEDQILKQAEEVKQNL